MKERPILFSAPMVQAILAGRKTQTRRLLKPPFEIDTHGYLTKPDRYGGRLSPYACPYGKPGDRLWVRETFSIVPRTAYRCSEGVQQTLRPDDDFDAAIYKAGWERSTGGLRWHPSIHMPRWASRILLEVVSVRVESLTQITEEDAKEEGYDGSTVVPGHEDLKFRAWFEGLWDSINGEGSFRTNPFVWVIEFRRVL